MIYFLKFWKEALIVLLCAGLWYFYQDAGILTEKLRISEEKYGELEKHAFDIQSKLDIQAKAAEEQTKAQLVAEQKRLQIISNLSSTVNTLRKQTPPTECSAAVVWSIEHKDELSWPK